MQSTVIINCTRGRGGFNFITSYNITVEGLTVINCGGVTNDNTIPIFNFHNVQSLFFHKNSIQHMTGYGLYVLNCDNVIVTNCSYYHSTLCNISDTSQFSNQFGGAIRIAYYTQYSHTGYTLELSHSNMTKCCNNLGLIGGGGGVYISLLTESRFSSVTMVLSHLILSQNSATMPGGNLAAILHGSGKVTLTISNCLISHGHSDSVLGGGMYFEITTQSSITIQNTEFVENINAHTSELYCEISYMYGSFSMINSTIIHTETHSDYGVLITGCCPTVTLNNTRIRITKQNEFGFHITSEQSSLNAIHINDCQFEQSQSVGAILYLGVTLSITNCTFSNNTGDHSVIVIDSNSNSDTITITNSTISDNSMTGITFIKGKILFKGRNVIQNNINTEGAGIKFLNTAYISVQGELLLYNNTAHEHGGAILVRKQTIIFELHEIFLCTIAFSDSSSKTCSFSGNRAGKGGSDYVWCYTDGSGDNYDHSQCTTCRTTACDQHSIV